MLGKPMVAGTKIASDWDQWAQTLFGDASSAVDQAWNSEMINKALRLALLTGGAGALAGAGLRGTQEVAKSFDEQGVGTMADPVVINIKNPNKDKKKLNKAARYEKPSDWPLSIPLWVLAGGLGSYGGYRGSKALADKIRAKLMQQDEEMAKGEFEDALKEQYDSSQAKTASDNSIARRIDQHFEAFEKQALSPGEVGGIGLTGMLALWALAHHNSYKRLKKTDPEALQLKIMDRQAKLRQLGSPPPVQFRVDKEDGEEKVAGAFPSDYPAWWTDEHEQANQDFADITDTLTKFQKLHPIDKIKKDPNLRQMYAVILSQAQGQDNKLRQLMAGH